jgi:HlyD family secretion protein
MIANFATADTSEGRFRMLTSEVGFPLRTLSAVPPAKNQSYRELRRTAVVASCFTLVLLGIAGFLLSRTVVAGAVVVNGTLVVDSGAKAIQHPQGGVVAKLLVKEDEHVTAEEPLILLDKTVDQAKFDSVATSLVEQRARLVRLLAERDDAPNLSFPIYDPSIGISQDDYAEININESRQFDLRRQDRDGQRAQLRSRIVQTQQETEADRSQLKANTDQMALVQIEVDKLQSLFSRNLIDYQRVSEMERTLSQLQGERGTLLSNISENDGKITELELQVDQVDQSLRSQLTDQISQTQGAIADLTEQFAVARDALTRTVIASPLDGIVHELSVHNAGAVVQPAETLMQIVPQNDSLVGQMHISPADIDQVYLGQEVTVHFTAFDRSTTPSVTGYVAQISPDLVQDQRTGAAYYVGRVEIDPPERAKLDPSLKLLAGMPLELFLKTGDRTILSYLTKPLSDQWRRAFR